MLRPVPTEEGPTKSSKGWEKLPPDKIENSEPIVKEAEVTTSNDVMKR
ncbi:MAG TPA: hypothetical protein VJ180_12825 [Pyrinomonadaceae bacterium]|nr:hypothetical protein [Pyrinomonadaceae bacterium]